MLSFIISMLILEVLNLVITDYEFRKWRLKEEPERSENTGVMAYIPRDAFGDIFTFIVVFWRKGKLTFFMRCLALCQGGVGVVMLVYGAYNIRNYPSSVANFSISRLRFYNVYFDDLLESLASLLVLCGCISILISVQGVSVTCVTSRTAHYVSAFINTGGIIVSTTVVTFWGVFNTKVRDDMELELESLFYTALRYSPSFTYAVHLVQNLGCCGIRAEGDYIYLLPDKPSHDRLYSSCSQYRPCAPVLQEHFRTFSIAGLFFVSIMLLLHILSLLCVNKSVGDLAERSSGSEEKITRRGVFGSLKQRIIVLWEQDRINGVSVILKFVTVLCGVALIVSGLLLRFDDVFEDINLYPIFYPLGFNNRRFTFYLTAVAYGMLGLGITEMVVSLYGLITYCWDSKFLVYILIVLRGAFTVSMVVILGLCIESTSSIYWTMYDQLITEFQKYSDYTQSSGLPWKFLYFKMECCGIGNYGDFAGLSLQYGRRIPIHCCTNVTEWDPGLESGLEDCTDNLQPGLFHETGCNDVLLDRFGGYMIILICLLFFLILFQIFDIVTSGRRIYIIKPGSLIDKEIGILVKSVTGKCHDNKITDSSEASVTAEPSEVDAGPSLPLIEDSKRNTILPSLKGQQPAPSTATPPSETTVGPRGRARSGKEKRQRPAKLHSVDVHQPESGDKEPIQNGVGLKGAETPNVGRSEDATETTSGRRSALMSSRSGHKTQVSKRADRTRKPPKPSIGDVTDDNNTVTRETQQVPVRGDGAAKDNERYTDDSQFELKESRISTEHPSVIPQGNVSTPDATSEQPDRSQTNDGIQHAGMSRDKKVREIETRKEESKQTKNPNVKTSPDDSNREQANENGRLDPGESDTKKYLNSVPSGLADTPESRQNDESRSDGEGGISQKPNVWSDESGGSPEVHKDNTNMAVTFESSEQHIASREAGGHAETVQSGASDKKEIDSETSHKRDEKVKDSWISNGQDEKVKDSGNSNGHDENVKDSGNSNRHDENVKDSGNSNGQDEKGMDSGISNGHDEKLKYPGVLNGQVEKEVNSETSDRHAEELSERATNVHKTGEKIEEDKTLNDKDTNVTDYDYEDDFSDEDNDDTNNIDFFSRIAGN
ncbi:uncharacterized protein LOC117341306 [Pecten maximus]|uniref:uncharacterized protein LOC117341306 n=1 Tax=Pecten maximus TaxID=6579 RepID=UPI001458211E|nr:uncharacterized protein LOC117341306 [Pecten maximus]